MSKLINMTGKVFGKLTVVGLSEDRIDDKAAWICKCECGRSKIIRGQCLRRGFTKSCGCGSNNFGTNQRHYKKHGQCGTTRYYLLKCAKQRAKRKNLECTLTLSDIPDIPKICPILGIKMISYVGKGRRGLQYNSPTLDRILPSQGYTKENVQIISNKANMIKSNATAEEIRLVYQHMIKYKGSLPNGSSDKQLTTSS